MTLRYTPRRLLQRVDQGLCLDDTRRCVDQVDVFRASAEAHGPTSDEVGAKCRAYLPSGQLLRISSFTWRRMREG